MKPEKQAHRVTKGYGRMPTWQKVLIYLVVAFIIYTVVYMIFFHSSSSTVGSSSGY